MLNNSYMYATYSYEVCKEVYMCCTYGVCTHHPTNISYSILKMCMHVYTHMEKYFCGWWTIQLVHTFSKHRHTYYTCTYFVVHMQTQNQNMCMQKRVLHCLSLTIVSYSRVHPCNGYISCIFYEKPQLHYTTFANNSGITATRIVDQQVLGSISHMGTRYIYM